MARVLITGANGFVGSHLAEHILSLGHEASCLVRRTSDLRWLKGLPVRLLYGEARDARSLAAAIEGQEYIFHAAGATRAWTDKEYMEINADGTLNMLEACLPHKKAIRKFVLVSSQAAAGPSPNGIMTTEDMPPRPVSAYGRSKLQAEMTAHGYEDRIPITVVRPTDVYGPRDKDGLYFFRDIKRHVVTIVGLRPAKLIATYVADVAAGIALAAFSEKSAGRTYFICSDKVHTWDEIMDTIARLMNTWIVKIRLGGPTVKMLGRWISGFAAAAHALGLRDRPPLLTISRTIEVAERFWNCSCDRARKDLGFAPKIDIVEGSRLTVEWYRAHGWL